MPYAASNSYARQVLKNHRKQIFCGKEQILKYERESYKITPIKTAIILGAELQEEGIIKTLIDYETVKKMGLKISAISPKQKWKRGQQTQYIVVREETFSEDYGRIPQKHFIQWDLKNRTIRLVGSNAGALGTGPWINIGNSQKKLINNTDQQILDLRKPFTATSQILKMWGGIEEEQIKLQEIPHLPLMISEDNRLICLPYEKNEPVIGVIGRKGSGKTMMCHSIIDHAYQKWGIPTGILNDRSRETETWCLPWEMHPIKKSALTYELTKINEHTLPLPCVYLHLNTKGLKYISHEKESGYKMSISFKKIIEKYDHYLKGKKEWELGKSVTHFRNIQKTLMHCETLEEVYQTVDNGIDEKIELSRLKIKSVMTDIFEQKFLDIQNKIPPEWKIKDINTEHEMEFQPFMSCLVAGLIPVIITSHIKDEGYFPQLFRYLTEDILNEQNNNEFLIKNKFKTWLFCDELPSIDRKGERNVATEVLGDIVAEGRMSRIGFIWASQNPEITTERIATNTMHLIAFKLTNEQANNIVKDFSLPKSIKADMTSLKTFEAVIATNERLIAYNIDGKEEKIENDAVRGRICFPLSRHKSPT